MEIDDAIRRTVPIDNSPTRNLPERWHRVSLPLAENHDVRIGAPFHQTALLPQNRGCFSADRFYRRIVHFNRSEKGLTRENVIT